MSWLLVCFSETTALQVFSCITVYRDYTEWSEKNKKTPSLVDHRGHRRMARLNRSDKKEFDKVGTKTCTKLGA